MVTLRKLLEEHPDWIDLPIAVQDRDGRLDYVGANAEVYQTDDSDFDSQWMVVVFTGN